jgi:hypothetical protein
MRPLRLLRLLRSLRLLKLLMPRNHSVCKVHAVFYYSRPTRLLKSLRPVMFSCLMRSLRPLKFSEPLVVLKSMM